MNDNQNQCIFIVHRGLETLEHESEMLNRCTIKILSKSDVIGSR